MNLSLLLESFIGKVYFFHRCSLKTWPWKSRQTANILRYFVNFEHCYLALVKRKEKKKKILLSVLNQCVRRATNFTELVILKQVPSLSCESFMDCLNAHLTTLSISLNALFAIVVISLSIWNYRILLPLQTEMEKKKSIWPISPAMLYFISLQATCDLVSAWNRRL